jgi:hypothetical protein
MPWARVRGPMRLARTDVTFPWSKACHRAYAALPLIAKRILPVFLPIYAVCFLFTGSRERLAKQLEVTDSPLRGWILSATDETDALDDLVTSRRDREFIDRLRSSAS